MEMRSAIHPRISDFQHFRFSPSCGTQSCATGAKEPRRLAGQGPPASRRAEVPSKKGQVPRGWKCEAPFIPRISDFHQVAEPSPAPRVPRSPGVPPGKDHRRPAGSVGLTNDDQRFLKFEVGWRELRGQTSEIFLRRFASWI